MAPSTRSQVWGLACGLDDGVIYIVGGSTASGDAPTDRVSAYDIASNSGTDKAVFPAPTLGLAGAAIGTKI